MARRRFGEEGGREVIDAIADRLAGVVASTRERIARTSEFDPVSEDLLITLAGILEKQLWMVRAPDPSVAGHRRRTSAEPCNVKHTSPIGTRYGTHASASVQVFLAHLPEANCAGSSTAACRSTPTARWSTPTDTWPGSPRSASAAGPQRRRDSLEEIGLAAPFATTATKSSRPCSCWPQAVAFPGNWSPSTATP